jgi:16S rRNA processing protein RimM
MKKEDCFYLGKITRTHSFKGEVVIKFDTDRIEEYTQLESVLIETDHALIPFFIEYLQPLPKGYKVKFEDIENEQDAQKIVDAGLYLPLDFLPPLPDDSFYYHELVGCEVFDLPKNTLIGTVKEVQENKFQDLLIVDAGYKYDVLIPMVDEILHHFDRDSKRIEVYLPEGLLELYQ